MVLKSSVGKFSLKSLISVVEIAYFRSNTFNCLVSITFMRRFESVSKRMSFEVERKDF